MKQYRTALLKAQAKRESALSGLKEAELSAASAASDLIDREAALKLAGEVAQQVQREAHGGVAAVVSRCLSAVFDSPYEFKLEFERARNRTQVRCVFLREGEEVDPVGGAGGGAVDVAAFALNLACLALSRPQPRKLLVMDEPLKWLHGRKHRERMAALLLALADDLEVQIIMSTGCPEYRVGEVTEL